MSYEVCRISYAGMPRDHHAIFVRTGEHEPTSGHIFQVTGNIQTGMRFEDKSAKDPVLSGSYVSHMTIGRVSVANYPHVLDICKNIPPPEKQFNGPRRIDPRKPLRRCQEWTAEAIAALVAARVLEISE